MVYSYANVSVFTTRRLKFAENIIKLIDEIAQNRIDRIIAENKAEASRKIHEEYKKEMSQLKKFIEEKREAIKMISGKTMTIEQARARLEHRHLRQIH